MQDGMLIHIPMSLKPININIHNMAKSEVYNTDCIEYMRTLPDNHFDLAVCDPPYGHGNDESLLGGGAEVRTAVPAVFQPTDSIGGGVFEKYHKPLRRMVPPLLPASGTGSKGDGGNDTTPSNRGGGETASPTMGRCTTTRVL